MLYLPYSMMIKGNFSTALLTCLYNCMYSLFNSYSGQLDFLEFIVCLWNLCSVGVYEISGLAFTMCDVNSDDHVNGKFLLVVHMITAV